MLILYIIDVIRVGQLERRVLLRCILLAALLLSNIGVARLCVRVGSAIEGSNLSDMD
jgi:hypothetical protein